MEKYDKWMNYCQVIFDNSVNAWLFEKLKEEIFKLTEKEFLK